ncbi:hypothetical protein SDC9_196158 [bioreactor metagenome]|uniref:Uncharacterized protein n=1 Tax=bioreactor metagenome TaxID=1076179 RepID=A0A645IB97_9ZZZZ
MTAAESARVVVCDTASDARSLESIQKGVGQRIHRRELRDRHGTFMPAESVITSAKTFDAPKPRQEVCIGPTRTTVCRPFVIQMRRPVHPDHPVDCRRSAKNPAARPVDLTPIELRIGLCVKVAQVDTSTQHRTDA